MRRLWATVAWASRWAAALLAIYLALVVPGVMGPSAPFDAVINLGAVPHVQGCRAPDDGRRHVVVLQHGLWRTATSLSRLERTLVAHGYEVLNPSYPSTLDTIEAHAEALGRAVQQRLDNGDPRPVALYAVGHSMGGLVLQAWLASSAVQPEACVFIATPHRGAILCDKRKDWALFRLLLGDQAALQLSPGSAFQQRVIRNLGDVGVIVGSRGDGEGWNADIPGDDDRTVAVTEARFPVVYGDRVTVRGERIVPYTHTHIAFAPTVLESIVRFLRQRTLSPAP